MILAFDTSTAACTAALFDGSALCVARADERIGRGHAERLVPMLDEMLQGRRADRIIVGVGPGSFTGIRVGLAAGHGMAVGWNVEISGMSSLALLAAGASGAPDIAAAIAGGHGELFVQQFSGKSLEPVSELRNLPPAAAAQCIDAHLVVGSGARQLVEARGWGEARDGYPSAENALRLPRAMRTLTAKPVYARAPDARALEVA